MPHIYSSIVPPFHCMHICVCALTSPDTGTGRLMACGGWSRRKTLFGGDQYSGRDDLYTNPERDPAKIRALFVHPDYGVYACPLAFEGRGGLV